MPIFLVSVKVNPASEVELEEVGPLDFATVIRTLTVWRPGIHILKVEGIYTNSSGYA